MMEKIQVSLKKDRKIKINILIFVGLKIAAQKNFLEMMDILLGFPGINVNIATPTEHEWRGSLTPLMIACDEQNPEIVKKLLRQENIDISYKDK